MFSDNDCGVSLSEFDSDIGWVDADDLPQDTVGSDLRVSPHQLEQQRSELDNRYLITIAHHHCVKFEHQLIHI